MDSDQIFVNYGNVLKFLRAVYSLFGCKTLLMQGLVKYSLLIHEDIKLKYSKLLYDKADTGITDARQGFIDSTNDIGRQLTTNLNTKMGEGIFTYNPVTFDSETGEYIGGNVTANPTTLSIKYQKKGGETIMYKGRPFAHPKK